MLLKNDQLKPLFQTAVSKVDFEKFEWCFRCLSHAMDVTLKKKHLMRFKL